MFWKLQQYEFLRVSSPVQITFVDTVFDWLSRHHKKSKSGNKQMHIAPNFERERDLSKKDSAPATH